MCFYLPPRSEEEEEAGGEAWELGTSISRIRSMSGRSVRFKL